MSDQFSNFKERFPSFIPEETIHETKEDILDILQHSDFFRTLRGKQKDIALDAFNIAIAQTIQYLNNQNYTHRAEVISTEQELAKIRQTIQDLVKFAKL